MHSTSTVSASRFLIAAVAAALILGFGPRPAVAKKRVAVLSFSGSKTSGFERQVKAIVKKRATLISHGRYVKTAKKLRAKKPTQRNVMRVARELSMDGMVIGSVKRRGSRYTLTLKVRAGADGEFIETIKVTTRRAKLTGASLRKVSGGLASAIRRLPSLEDDGDDDDDDDRGFSRTKPRRGKGDDKSSRRKRGGDDDDKSSRRKRSGDDDDDDDDDGRGRDDDDPFAKGDDDDDRERRVARRGDDDDDDDSVEKKSDGDASPGITDERKADLLIRGRGLELTGGVSVVSRKLSFTVSADLGDAAPRGYSGTPVAGAYIAGELYPLAFNLKNKGVTRNLGVAFHLDRVLKIESRLRYQDAMNMEQEAVLPTEQQRLGVGVVYRHNFGSSPTSPTIKAGIRYNKGKFIIDKAAAPAGVVVDIPNMDYTYVDPGLVLRYPVNSTIALQADARFLLVTDTGEMQQTDQYGGATVTGYDIDLAADYRYGARLFFRAGFRLSAIAYDFNGTGAQTTDRDADAEQDVFGALDRYLGGYGVAGYVF